MNVLLIAPDLGLPLAADEERAISLALHPVILNGTVTRRDVLNALTDHSWDVLWFVTHGDDHGIQLTDGYLSTSDLTAVVRASGAHLVVLNTCSSRGVGLELHHELGVSVITTVGEINDATAYQAGALLAAALAETHDVVQAFAASRPGQSQNYLLFHNRTRDEGEETRTILMLNEWGARLSGKIDGLERRMDREITALRREVETLSSDVRQSVRLPTWHRAAFVMAFGLLFLPLPLFYDQVRDGLDVGWQSALALSVMAYAASAVLWAYMWWGGR